MPELKKYLKHHNQNDKVKTIMGHSLQMNTLRTGETEVGGSNESGHTDSRGESSEGEETDDEYKSDAPDSEDDSNDVVLAFITSDEEYADERPAITCSGRAVTTNNQQELENATTHAASLDLFSERVKQAILFLQLTKLEKSRTPYLATQKTSYT